MDKGVIASEMLTYQLCLALRFLKDLGIPDNVIRLRQHLTSEMRSITPLIVGMWK